MDKDWNVPWPDGSWLTWNEETEAWEKHDGPPPEERRRKKTTATDAQTTAPKAAAIEAKKTTPKPTATTKKKTTPKVTGAGRTAPAPAAASASAPAPAAAKPRAQVSGGAPSAWRPVAEGATRAAAPATRAPVRSDVPVASRERHPLARAREPREGSLLPTIAWGCVVGVVAGYFLSFLIR